MTGDILCNFAFFGKGHCNVAPNQRQLIIIVLKQGQKQLSMSFNKWKIDTQLYAYVPLKMLENL